MEVRSWLLGRDLGAASRELLVKATWWWMESYKGDLEEPPRGNDAPGNEDLRGRWEMRSLRWETKPIQRSKGK